MRADIMEDFKGTFESIQEQELRRLIIKLLIIGALEECFIATNVKSVGTSNISVYLQLGKYANSVENNTLRVYLNSVRDEFVLPRTHF